jgi:hypothetical protein
LIRTIVLVFLGIFLVALFINFTPTFLSHAYILVLILT